MAPESLTMNENNTADAGEAIDISQLSLEERLAHKNWKVRLETYKELSRLFHLASSPKDSIFREYWEAVKKAPLEQNAAAQELALSFVISFLKCSDLAIKSRSNLVGPLVEKGLMASKNTSRTSALESIMVLIEAESANPIVEEMLQILGRSSKQQKLITAILVSLRELIKSFGNQVIPWKMIVKQISGETYFGHADKNIRQEAMSLIIEIHRWVKDEIFALLEGLRPVQMKEIQEQCSQNILVPTPSRWLFSQRPVEENNTDFTQEAMMQDPPDQIRSSKQLTTENNENCVVVDDYETAEPVDIISMIPESFYENMSSSKWKERKEALDSLLTLLNRTSRAQEGRYGELIHLLCRHIQTDANILVVIAAANCIGALTKSLRNSINGLKTDCIIPSLLERCKEKKANVTEALRNALDAQVIGFTGSLLDIIECLSGFFTHKNPSVKSETLLWLSRIFAKKCKVKPLSKKDLTSLTNSLILLMDDGSTEVRDSAALVFSTLNVSYGESVILPMISGQLDKVKLAKISNLKPGNTAAPDTSKSALSSASQVRRIPEQPKREISQVEKVKPKSNGEPVRPKLEPVYKFSEGEAATFFSSNFSSIYESLGDANWKNRLEAISSLTFESSLDPELVVRMVIHRPGWKDSNVMVLSKAIDSLSKYPGSFNLESVSLLLASGLMEKVSEQKLQKDIFNLFNKCAEDIRSPHYVFSQLLTLVLLIKNPKSASETIKYLQCLVLDFGQQTVPPHSLASEMSIIKQLLLNTNPLIRGSSIELAGSLKGFYGNKTVRDLLSDVPNATLSSIDAEFSKVSHPQEPRKATKVSGKKASNLENVTGASMEVPIIEDSVQRCDETLALTNVLEKINDSNWKIRKEALDEINVITMNGKKITCSAGIQNDLLAGLKNRLLDTNKNIVIQALDVSNLFLEAVPLASIDKTYLKGSFIPTVCSCLSDNKVQVRNSAVGFLQKSSKFVPGLIGVLREELKCDSPNAKREILLLMTEIMETRGFVLSDEGHGSIDLITTAIIACLQDRNGDVRKVAQTALQTWSGIVGNDSITKICQKAAPSIMNSLLGLLSKEKLNTTTKTLSKSRVPLKSSSDSMMIDGSSTSIFLNDPGEDTKRTRMEKDKSLALGFWILIDGSSSELKHKEFINQCEGALSTGFTQQLLSNELKDQLSCLSTLENFIAGVSGKHHKPDEVINNLDLILKYFSMKLPDCSLAFFTKYLDLVEKLFSLLDEANYRLSDAEIVLFLTPYATKSSSEGGMGRDNLKSRVRSIYRQLCRIYPASRIMVLLLELCKTSKSSKVRIECLEEINALVNRNGSSVLVTPNKQLPVIAALVGDKDSTCRNLALILLVQIHEIIGEEAFYKNLGENSLNGKDLDLFLEKLKRKDLQYVQSGQNSGSSSKVASTHSTPVKSSKVPHFEPETFDEEMAEPEQPLVYQNETKKTSSFLLNGADCNSIENNASNCNNNFNLLFRKDGTTPFEDHHPLDHLIDLIGCTADLQCMNTMQRIEELLLKKEKALQSRIGPLIHALVIRLKEACSGELPLDNDPEVLSNKAKLAKFIINSILDILNDSDFAAELEGSPDIYRLLIEETIRSLLGKRVEQELGQEEREVVQKSLNLLLVKSLESVSPNLSFRSLLSSLENAFIVPPGESTDKYPEMVMKCLWKLTKMVGSFLTKGLLDLGNLLNCIQDFLGVIPPMEWKTRASKQLPFEDMPLRTVKTIIHELVGARGLEVLTECNRIFDHNQNYTWVYVKTFLSAAHISIPDEMLQGKGAVANAPLSSSNSNLKKRQRSSLSSCSNASLDLSPAEIDEKLKDICGRICSKPDTRSGLLELFNFKRDNPRIAVQIDAFVSSLGSFFKKYIERGLERIEAEFANNNPSSPITDLESYRHKLVSLKSQMFGEASKDLTLNTDSTSKKEMQLEENENISKNASPLRSRLESPAAKFARFGCSPKSLSSNATLTSDTLPPKNDAVISNLKERLARLKQQ